MLDDTFWILGGGTQDFVLLCQRLLEKELLWCCFSDKLGSWVICTQESTTWAQVEPILLACKAEILAADADLAQALGDEPLWEIFAVNDELRTHLEDFQDYKRLEGMERFAEI